MLTAVLKTINLAGTGWNWLKTWLSEKDNLKHAGIILFGAILLGMLFQLYHHVHYGCDAEIHIKTETVTRTLDQQRTELERLERVAANIDTAVRREVASNDTEIKSDDILLVLDTLRARYLAERSKEP